MKALSARSCPCSARCFALDLLTIAADGISVAADADPSDDTTA